jgi:alpha,alpha-trehalase
LDSFTLNRYIGSLSTPRAEGYGKEKRWASNLPESERPQYHRHLRAVCESGWDFSSRWFADGQNKSTTVCEDIIPVCLNSLLFGLETQLKAMHMHRDDSTKAADYQQFASARQKAIQAYLWSEENGFFKDFNHLKKEQTAVLSLATVYPLYFGIATDEQAASVADVVKEKLLFPGGVVTTTVNTGEQWDFPNGWAPLQWMTVKGLARYGHDALAEDIASRWLALNEKVFREEGKMMEKYNVVDTTLMGGGGEYKNQDGFGWTNGVALGLDAFLNEH